MEASSSPSPGDSVFVLAVFGGENPVALVQESIVHSMIPGYGILRTVGSATVPAKSEDVFGSREEADTAAAARLRMSLARITRAYESRIEEIESNGR